MKSILVLFFLSFSSYAIAQDTLMPVVFLDDVVISEEKDGFTIEDFVRYVKNDTTFYMGFKHLRYYTHDYQSELYVFNKKRKIIAEVKKKGTYFSDGSNAFILKDSTYHTGRIFKRNGKYRYYTPQAFDEVFFPKDTIPVSLSINRNKRTDDSQNMRDAKTVGFSIGSSDTEQSKGGMSKRLEVFDVSMQKYYDYIISDTIYRGRECYVFSIKAKKDLKKKDLGKALIRNLVSYFDKSNFHVIYREYKFVYKNVLLSLDIDVLVHMDYINDIHVPTDIYYKGDWNVVFFKPERAEFILRNNNYLIR